MSEPELLPCPHCGARMIVRQRSAFHPGGSGLVTSECWLADYELDEFDYPAWNRRTPASTVLPDRAPARDTPASPNAREAALMESAQKVRQRIDEWRLIGKIDNAEIDLLATVENDIRALAKPACLEPSYAAEMCEGCPPVGYPTDETRCLPCPRRSLSTSSGE